ncbi:MAG: hypothetical protein R3Y32_01530 [Bacillota bacterium]
MNKKIVIFLIIILTLASFVCLFSACENELSQEFLPPQTMWVESGVLYWEKVSGVDQYILNINGEDITVKNNYYADILPDVEYTVTVKASKIWEISDKSESFTFTVLDSPDKIQYIGEVLFWTEVEGAVGYLVEINDIEYYYETNVIGNFIFPFPETQSIRIKAIGDDETYYESKFCEDKEFYILPRYLDDYETIQPSGTGTSTDPYLISSIENFKWICTENDNGNTFKGQTLLQTANLDFRYICDYQPIGLVYSFEGTYDGDNYGIYNLSYVGQLSGIFGVIGSSGTVANLLKSGGEIEGRVSAGSIAAINNGQINNCVNYSYIYGNTCGGIVGQNNNNGSVVSCDNYSNILGDTSGGIVGWNMDGIILGCVNHAVIESTSIAGGICGNNAGFISISQNLGTVDSKISGGIAGENRGEIEYSSNDAYIRGTMYAGGICGDNEDSISFCYAYGYVAIDSVTQNSYAGGLAGRNTEGQIVFSFALNEVINNYGKSGSVVGYYRIGLIENAYTSNQSLSHIGNEAIYVGEIIDFTEDLQNAEYVSQISDLIKERYEEITYTIYKYTDKLVLYFE